MKPGAELAAALILGAALGASAVYVEVGGYVPKAFGQPVSAYHLVQAKDGGVVIQLCDGVTTTEVRGLKPGQRMDHAQAIDVTRRLMAEWQRKHPDQHWKMAQAESTGPAPRSALSAPGGSTPEGLGGPSASQAPRLKSQQGDTYASFSERDSKIWQVQTEAFVAYGKKVFHSTQLLGSTIGVSCDMCHPDAANTHPETYPKYQVQLQRVALLRDMIDWCIENPVRGKTLDPNDAKMRALEAYIIAQRKGLPLAYGKH